MNKHTPGPWLFRKVGFKSHSFYIYGTRPEGFKGQFPYSVARIPNSPIAPSEANARLIAAAPDLLAALENVLPFLTGTYWAGEISDPSVDAARAAIAKASGEAHE